jgi:hypothetical protein
MNRIIVHLLGAGLAAVVVVLAALAVAKIHRGDGRANSAQLDDLPQDQD